MTKMVDRRALSDAAFLASRRAAFRAELAVAYTCVHAGAIEVTVPVYQVRPSFDRRSGYRDHGDLRVRWRHGGRLHRYEIKHRDITFSSHEDYPYPTVFVDEVANLNDKDPRPDAYWVCNATLDAALFIDLRNYASFEVSTKFDTRYNQQIEFYSVPAGRTRCIALSWR